MVKFMLLLAFTAQTLFLASSTGDVKRSEVSSSESSSSSSSIAEASTTFTEWTSPVGPCSHGHAYQEESSTSVASSSSSSSSSYSSSNETFIPVHHPDCRSCRKHEIWVPCPVAVCVPKLCKNLGFPIPCYDLRPDGKCPGKPGCICKTGYVRDHRGVCIPVKHCPSCGGDANAEAGCGTHCNRLCSNYNKKNVSCIKGCFFNSCECKAGHVYDEVTKKCVLPRNCTPPIKCKKLNEVYDTCPAPCPYRTCGINDAAVSCAPALPNGHPDCAPPKCRCRDGFYRDNVGNCVRWKDCPKCKNPNEIYDPCPAPCPPRTCDVDEALILCLVPPQIGDAECEPGCRCMDGFVRNHTGICIPKDQCPKCPKPNEVYDPCISSCPPRRCDVDPRVIKCAKPLEVGDPLCVAGCRCADGYVTNYEGVCIPRDKCPPQCPINERYSECVQSNCSPQKCTQLGFPIPCPRINPKYCKGGCLCEEGFVRNEYGICIRSTECPSCGGDQNAQAGCGGNCNKRCSDIGKEPRFCNLICEINGCVCKKGYYFDDNRGKCVRPEQCTPTCGINEEYNKCANNNCNPKNCTEVGFPIPGCPRSEDPKNCQEGCQCKSGYTRNLDGVCVPVRECPSCRGDPNKIAGCGVYCNQHCRDVGMEPRACIAICYENDCDCRKGYVLDENTGLCVLPKHCTPQCPVNEWYCDCIQGQCNPKNCSEVGLPLHCPRIDPKDCKKGCLCKEGYARNKNGICVPLNQCPTCGGDPNAVPGCGVYCNQRCRDVGKKPGLCILMCRQNACDCREGYKLDENTGKCVLPEQCTPQCPPNEQYSKCVQSNCSPQKCTQLGFPIHCPKINPKYCKGGCLCKAGHVRDENGICIRSTQCPSCGGDPNAQSGCGGNCNRHCYNIGQKPGVCALSCILNGCDCKEGYFHDDNIKKCVKPEHCTPICLAANNEVYSDCINGGCQPKNCSQYDKPVPCVKMNPKYCIKGCLCKEGYLRARNGKCIPKKDCPEACNGPYEVYNNCSWDCPPQTCESLDRAYVCPIKKSDNCKPMCRCEPGRFRNKIGLCITEEECRKCMGPHEYYNCGVACDNVCKTIHEQSQDNCPIINVKCNEKCYCEKGYARAENNTCIPISCCNEPQCPINERYEKCPGASCEPQHCSQLGLPIPCPAPAADGRCPGKPGCVCVDGYLRDKNGKCVPKKECPPICLAANNEVYSDCINGGCQPKNCSQYDKPVPCVKIHPKYCIKGCLCKEGYLRARNGKCIPKKDCPEACNGPYEVYNNCSWDCPPQTCESLDKRYMCPLKNVDNCKPMCRCEPGRLRNKIGLCITEEECRKCMGPHEYYNCGVACDNVCKTIHEQSQDNCPIINVKCNEKCYCEKGYARAENNTCIPISCCNEPQCPINERYEKCPGASCEPQHCSQLGLPIPCPARAADGRCPGKPGCVCVDGYLRDKNGRCVPKKECPPICLAADNEVYSDCINGGCQPKNCSQYGKPVPCVKIDPKHCIKGCLCKEGYLRARNGKCIPKKYCPEACNGPYEVYNNCSWDCPPQTCESLDRAYVCPIKKGDKCKPMCRCEPGRYRNIIGLCITEEECRKCMGPHEYYSCGGACDNVCKTIHEQSQDNCPIINIKCNEKCYCEKGYARAENKTCIPISCCNEPQCPINERYEKCPAASCEPQHCSQLGFPIPCPVRAADGRCPGKPGCVCVDGYLRDKNGRCVLKKECPSCRGDPNAESGCGVNCLKKCYDLQNPDHPRPCPKICHVNACDCKEGYYLDENTGRCVLAKNCSPTCGKDEVYSPCVNSGCEKKDCSQLGQPQICIDPIKCIRGCKCKEGFLRLKNGTCVPYDQCPPPKCNKNERFELCPAKVCQPQSCKEVGFPIHCVPTNDTCPGYPDCICDYGYVRNSNGICRPKSECTSCGGDPNAQPGCGINCGKRCPNNYLNPKFCPRICLSNACDCKDTFYYDANIKKCVKLKDCSPRCDELNNEVYDSCVNGGCDWKNCSQVGGPIICIDPMECKKGCSCKKGYYRLNNGTCVPENECPLNCWKPNEVYDPCPPKCPSHPQSCEIESYEYCPEQNASDCIGECRCKPNFYRNEDGDCVSEDDCFKCTGP